MRNRFFAVAALALAVLVGCQPAEGPAAATDAGTAAAVADTAPAANVTSERLSNAASALPPLWNSHVVFSLHCFRNVAS